MQTANARSREDDPRFQRSLAALLEAVASMIEETPVSDLTITHIVKRAGVTRPTFYQHFANVPEAARTVAMDRLREALPVAVADFHDGMTAERLRDWVKARALPVLTHLDAHRLFYRRVLDDATNVAFFGEILAFIGSRMIPQIFDAALQNGKASRDDLQTMLAGGMMCLVIRWLREEPRRTTPDAMALRIGEITASLVVPARR